MERAMTIASEVVLVNQYESLVNLIFRFTNDKSVFLDISLNSDGETFSLFISNDNDYLSKISEIDTYKIKFINIYTKTGIEEILGKSLTRIDVGADKI